MKLDSLSFADGGSIPGHCAFAVIDPAQHVALAGNRNPQLAWHDVPAGTQSFVLTYIDPDAPTRPDDVNQEGRVVPASLPRGEFLHWLMVDIPADVREIAEGACSDGVTARGKTAPAGPAGSRQGANDYTAWFAGDADMQGRYLGYDGPCPPWNDEIPHRYVFQLHALDVARCPVDGEPTLAAVRAAIEGHVLATATLTGRYTLNPAVTLD